MHRSLSLLILLALISLFVGFSDAKRGGGGGGGSDSDDDGGSSSGGGDDGDDSSGPGYVAPPPAPPCDMGECACAQVNEREELYRLPGLYYNGTVKVTHRISSSSAWDLAAEAGSEARTCDNNDDQTKTYEYPALLMVGPTGNSSDSNPIFWALRAFQPPDQQLDREQYLNVDARWIHIRSSDFVVTDNSLEASYFGQYDYYASDETGRHQVTKTYWDTDVTDMRDSTFSADATYRAAPPDVSPVASISEEENFPKSSQYITLSDVCRYGYEFYLASGAVSQSQIPEGNNYFWTTLATVFLQTGASARLEDIGSPTARFSLNGTSGQNDLVFTPTNPDVSCEWVNTVMTKFTNQLSLMEEMDKGGTLEHMWNMTVTMGLSFEGDLVRENSTTINGTSGGTPTFAKGFETSSTSTTAGSSTPASSWAAPVHHVSDAEAWAFCFLLLAASSLALL